MKHALIYIITLGCLYSCNKEEGIEPDNVSHSHIEYFGFTLIDTYWDDPTDIDIKTNYADEIHTFSNLADILVISPLDDIAQRVQNFNELDILAILHLAEIFFELKGTDSPSGADYHLRENYKERWNNFVNINQSILTDSRIGAYYIGEEPTWNGISFNELNTVTTLIKSQFPLIPIMIVEAYPALDDLQVPQTADWIGFDHYFIKNPNTSSIFQQEWATLKTKLSTPSQKIVVVMDSHHMESTHRDLGDIELNEMDDVTRNYYQLAKNDASVIAILGYFWPNGFDFVESIGARGMPKKVMDEYVQIGKEITGKN